VPHTAGSKSHARVTQEMVRILSQYENRCHFVSRTNNTWKQQIFVG
jgi:hypothetical protein